ncbi:MAG: CDP-diacylglycerol--glycerol-3-phosphate 3-phosphatidyltransferase [Anaerofustis sp.]
MNIANRITIVRILMIPLYIGFLYWNRPWCMIVAGIIFILASITDTVDGYIARKYDMVTDFGKFLDPLADKLLVLTALIIFMGMGRIPSWAVVVIVARELIVTSFRCVAASKNKVLAADVFGKLKTIFQLIAVSCMHFELSIGNWLPALGGYFSLLIDILFYISVMLTIFSGFNYLYKNREVLH